MAWPALSARSKNWGTEVLTDTDLEGEFDLLHTYINAALNSSTGHKHDGTTAEGPKIDTGGLAADAADATIVDLADDYTWTGTHDFSGATLSLPVISWDELPDGAVVQVVNTQDATEASTTSSIPWDDTIPQNTEGDELMTLAITPKATTNKLKIDVVVVGGAEGDGADVVVALFQDSTANALAATVQDAASSTMRVTLPVKLTYYMAAGTTSETTFKVRIGTDSGTFYVNQVYDGTDILGGTLYSSITITEIKSS